MNRILLLACTGFAGLTLAACQPSANDQDNDVVNAAQDTTAGAVGATSAATMGAHDLGAYVSNAAQGDMYEIQAADIALQRTTNADVRALATMIKTDHTMASEHFAPLVAAAGQTLPTGLDERRSGLLDNLRGADMADFDRVYLEQQVAAHNEALTLHRGFSDNTDYPDLAAHSQSVIAPVTMHLERAEALRSAMN